VEGRPRSIVVKFFHQCPSHSADGSVDLYHVKCVVVMLSSEDSDCVCRSIEIGHDAYFVSNDFE
jgi:hypothetical protein